MITKIVDSIAVALEGIKDGATILLGGFGSVGQPDALVDGIIELGVRDLVIVANNAGATDGIGLSKLIEIGRVRRMICSFPRSLTSTIFERMHREGRVELELVPQGTLAERIRAAGAGIPAFYTPTGVGTLIAAGKPTLDIDGRTYLMEKALPGDVALVEAWQADRWGNLTFRESGRNFNPIMATAAKLTVVQAQHLVELGDLPPETIVTPGIYVDRVVHVPYDLTLN